MTSNDDLKGIIEFVKREVTLSFFSRFLLTPVGISRHLIIVSPWISDMKDEEISLKKIITKINIEKIRTTVFTRPPIKEYHINAIDMLKKSEWVEIYYNERLHAKFYVLLGRKYDYALMSSANLTKTGISGHEIGIFIFSRAWGSRLIKQFRDTALIYFRLLSDSEHVKSFGSS